MRLKWEWTTSMKRSYIVLSSALVMSDGSLETTNVTRVENCCGLWSKILLELGRDMENLLSCKVTTRQHPTSDIQLYLKEVSFQ